jgi:hypothetical protein
VIDSGVGWWHILVETSDVNSDLFALSTAIDAIEKHEFGVFVTNEIELRIIIAIHISILKPALYFVSPTHGYHDGNALLGLLVCDGYLSSWVF